MEKKDPIAEAKRHIQKAQDIMREKAGKDGNYYTEAKYVKMAGDTAWKGVQLSLDAVFNVRKDRRTRVSIDDYKDAVAKRDNKLFFLVGSAYNLLYIGMGYDGEKSYRFSRVALETATKIVSWCEKQNKR